MSIEIPELDISTLKFVVEDLYTQADILGKLVDAGVLDAPVYAEDALSKAVYMARYEVLRAMSRRYQRWVDDLTGRGDSIQVPAPYQPPPVESKQTRRIRTKLDALQPLPKGTPVGPTPSARPRDFMAQAVSMALVGHASGWPAPAVLRWILNEPACQSLFLRTPTLERVRDTLSAGARDPKNPRFLRAPGERGWYKNNPKYKKAK